jgi:hypothetical protein
MYCPRGYNKVAHVLGALGVSRADSDRLWLEEVPDSVGLLVASDIARPLS